MATDTIHLKLKVNFPVILSLVALVHLLLMLMNGLPSLNLSQFIPKRKGPRR